MAGSSSQYSILVDVQLQEESIKKQLKEIQNNKDTKLKIGVTADGTERTKKELDGVTQSTKNLDNSTKDLMFTYQQYRQVLDSVINVTEKIKMTKNEDGEEIAKRVVGTARIIRNSLPNATYIGFTGTPISSRDRSTREVFGDYIDIYDMTQAVEDGATRPVYYESRVIKLNLDEATLRLIDTEYEIMAHNADLDVIEKSKRTLGQMEAVLGNDNTINSLVADILDHYENYREGLLTGKAMIVAYSRPIAMKIYKRILELRPTWTEKVGIVMTA